MSVKLTDSQLVILSAASNRDGGLVLPLPVSLTLNKGSAAIVLKSLLGRGLITEVTARPGSEIWRENDDGERLTLRLTEAGVRVLGLDPEGLNLPSGCSPRCSEFAAEAADGDAGPEGRPALPASGTKLASILALLQRQQGATLEELTAATGWQAHSVRGAISGAIRRKLGLAVKAEVMEGRGRTYRIPAASPTVRPDEVA